MSELRFFNPYAEIRHTGSRLPHWQQQGAVYFVTFRLADSIPSRLRDQWQSEQEAWLERRFSIAGRQKGDYKSPLLEAARNRCAQITA